VDAIRLLWPIWSPSGIASLVRPLSGLATAAVLATVNTAIDAEGGLPDQRPPGRQGLIDFHRTAPIACFDRLGRRLPAS
jgi:hypothetical protein